MIVWFQAGPRSIACNDHNRQFPPERLWRIDDEILTIVATASDGFRRSIAAIRFEKSCAINCLATTAVFRRF